MAKRKSQVQTEEENRSRRIMEFIKECKWIPEPSYLFKVGDGVEIGNLENVVIVEVFENGKFYEIDYTRTDTNYGNPITTHHNKAFWWWFDLRPITTRKDESFIENSDLQLHYSQRDVNGLFHYLYDSRLNMNPSYQREYVWNQEDKVILIDSVMKNIDIGKFVIVKLPYSESFLYEVLDGKQRINALAEFYENRFAYRGYFYNDLSRREKSHFKYYRVVVAEISHVTEEQKLRYFLMLNRTGKVMDRNHLDNIERMLTGK